MSLVDKNALILIANSNETAKFKFEYFVFDDKSIKPRKEIGDLREIARERLAEL